MTEHFPAAFTYAEVLMITTVLRRGEPWHARKLPRILFQKWYDSAIPQVKLPLQPCIFAQYLKKYTVLIKGDLIH
jgi:hypothetical protein